MMRRSTSTKRYYRRLRTLLQHPFFWSLTILGNGFVLLGSFFLQLFESDKQIKPMEYLDFLLWSTGTVSTVGYGNYTPVTLGGKITLLFLMMLGPLFIWLYMAFWVTGMLAPELAILEDDVHEVEKEIKNLKFEKGREGTNEK